MDLQWIQQLKADVFHEQLKKDEEGKKISDIPTEFIVSLRKKKEWFDRLSRFSFPPNPSKELLVNLFQLLGLMNRYLIEHPVLQRLFDYLCHHEVPLSKSVYIKRYFSPENIQAPYYDQLRAKLKERGEILGNHFVTPVYLLFMMGTMVGYVFTEYKETEKIMFFKFDNQALEVFFKEMHPTL
jgi:hypothetical protein